MEDWVGFIYVRLLWRRRWKAKDMRDMNFRGGREGVRRGRD